MRSYEFLAEKIEQGQSVAMPDGEIVTSIVRLAILMDSAGAPDAPLLPISGEEAESLRSENARLTTLTQVLESENQNQGSLIVSLRTAVDDAETGRDAAEGDRGRACKAQSDAETERDTVTTERDDLKRGLDAANARIVELEAAAKPVPESQPETVVTESETTKPKGAAK